MSLYDKLGSVLGHIISAKWIEVDKSKVDFFFSWTQVFIEILLRTS